MTAALPPDAAANLFGAVCPERKTGAAIVMPDVNIKAMNEHLAAISKSVSVGAIAVQVCKCWTTPVGTPRRG